MNGQMFGTMVKGDFHQCDVAFFWEKSLALARHTASARFSEGF
ncbi:MAG: hypothetical protein CM15mP103_06450 [Gammaproteobacteria bacterium]|nr:MAG: hypothetical protein CM15mP103_06450 [Gammaproteobacteria bacterium]